MLRTPSDSFFSRVVRFQLSRNTMSSPIFMFERVPRLIPEWTASSRCVEWMPYVRSSHVYLYAYLSFLWLKLVSHAIPSSTFPCPNSRSMLMSSAHSRFQICSCCVFPSNPRSNGSGPFEYSVSLTMFHQRELNSNHFCARRSG